MKKYLILLMALCLLLAGCTPTAGHQRTPAAEELVPDTVYSLQAHALETGQTLPTKACRTGDSLYFIAEVPVGDSTEEALCRLGLTTGSLTRLCTYPAASEEAESFTAVAGIFPGSDGTVWLMENTTHYIFDLPRNFNEDVQDRWEYYQYRGDTTVMRQLDVSGQELRSFTLTNLQSSLNAALQAGDYILCAQGETLLFLTAEGETAATLTAPGWITALAADGDSVCLMTDHEETPGGKLYRLNLADLTLDEGTPLPTTVYTPAGLHADTLYYTERGNVFAWNLLDGSGKKLLDWQDFGINRSHIGSVFAMEDGRMAALRSTEQGLELLLLTPNPSGRPAEAALTLGVLWPDENTMDLVLSFNAASRSGRIRVADYSEYDVLGQSGLDRLRLDLASGAAPDLLFSPNWQYPLTAVAEHHLQDLTPYLDRDQSLRHQGLMTSVFDALRSEDGQLLTVASCFTLSTAVGRTDLLRPTPIGVSRALMLAQGLESDSFAPIEPYTTRQAAFEAHLTRLAGAYFTAESADLAQSSFTDGLALAALYPEALDWRQYERAHIADSWYRVRAGWQLYLPGSYSRFSDVARDMSAVGEEAVLCGWPDVPGGHVLEVQESWGMTSSCRNENLAWSFLRTILTETYQTSHTLMGFPTNRSAFRRMGRNAMQSGTVSYHPQGTEMIEISTRLTQAQYDALLQAADDAETLARYVPDGLAATIYAAVSDYFAGDATAEEAAATAQLAARQYLAPVS